VTVGPFRNLTREQVIVFSWSSNEDAVYQCAIDDPRRLFKCGSGRASTWRTPPLSDGEHAFYLIALDTVGNKASPKRNTFTVGECTFRHCNMHSWKITYKSTLFLI
jgi:hypothetical protein